MSVFENYDKDSLIYEIEHFLEGHTIYELMTVVNYCIEAKENELREAADQEIEE